MNLPVLPVSHGGLPGTSPLKAQTAVQLLRLLERVLAHEVLIERLVELGDELHCAVEEVHLVDEEVTLALTIDPPFVSTTLYGSSFLTSHEIQNSNKQR